MALRSCYRLASQSHSCIKALVSSNALGAPLQQPSKTSLPLAATTRWYSLEEPTSGYRYAKSHEWVSTDDPKVTTVGISNYAQEKLGELVFVELPDVGKKVEQSDELAVLESVKAAADVYAPVEGTVVEVNSELLESPSLVNESPYENGWLVKLEGVDESQVNALMSAEEYKTFLSEEGV